MPKFLKVFLSFFEFLSWFEHSLTTKIGSILGMSIFHHRNPPKKVPNQCWYLTYFPGPLGDCIPGFLPHLCEILYVCKYHNAQFTQVLKPNHLFFGTFDKPN